MPLKITLRKIFCICLLSLTFPGAAAWAADIDIFINKDLEGFQRRTLRYNDAFYGIIHTNEMVIEQTGGMFMTPYIPLDADGHFLSDKIYLAYFKPNYENLWTGNLKRFTMSRNGLDGLLDDSGNIRGSANFDWDSGRSNDEIDGGGVNAVIANSISARRKFYTYTNSLTNRLASSENAFEIENSKLTTAMLEAVTEQERQRIIEAVHSAGFGAVIHSQPARAYYPAENQHILFIGTNSGVLHCINDRDGSELWAFVMPEHLARLKNVLYSNVFYNSYFADNTPVIRDISGQKILIYGSRRGGSSYVALDITDYRNPLFLYSIDYDWLDETRLGLSWGVPIFVKIHSDVILERNNDTSEAVIPNDEIKTYLNVHDVVILPGGYDLTTSLPMQNGQPSRRGQAVIGFDPLTGKKDPAFDLLDAARSPILQHDILDVTAAAMNGQNVADRLYFGDTGGNLFYAIPFSPRPYIDPASSTSRFAFKAASQLHPYKIFKTAGEGPSTQKIMYAPRVLIEKGREYIYFGTGDRENPADISVANKFYCIRLDDWRALSPSPEDELFLTENDLADITENWLQDGNERQKTQMEAELATKSGWMLTLDPGEKVVSRPVIYDGIVFFTTYTVTRPADDLRPPAGEARLYGLHSKNGAAAYNFRQNKAADNLTKVDRYLLIGDTMPTSPTLYVFKDKILLLAAAGKKIFQIKFDFASATKILYWRQY